jgi:hypothetical protein
MVLKAFANKSCEHSLITTYWKMYDMLGPDKMAQYNQHRNNEGLNPVEWALFLNTYGLALAMINTPGLYLVREVDLGVSVVRWYDVTNYERDRKENYLRHLCYGLLFLHEGSVSDDNTLAAHTSKFYQNYIHKKFTLNIPFCLIWILTKVHVIFMTFLYTVCGRWAVANGPESVAYNSTNMTPSTEYSDQKCTVGFFMTNIMSDVWIKVVACYLLLLFASVCAINIEGAYFFIKAAYNDWGLRKLTSKFVLCFHLYHSLSIASSFLFLILFLNEVTILFADRHILGDLAEKFTITIAHSLQMYGLLVHFQLIDEIG